MSVKLDDFRNPTALDRPAPFWSWNDRLHPAELTRQIEEMAEKGWGGYFMHSRVGLVTGYLSDEWMACVRACALAARRTGTLAWLYDEDKWPSGFAGGLVPRADRSYRLRTLVFIGEDEAGENDTVMARVTWEGIPRVIAARVAALGNAWFNGASYVDLMNPDAVRYFLACTHEKYKAACGEFFGNAIPGVFTDEPTYTQNSPNSAPWSEGLREYFRQLRGYDIADHLPSLFLPEGDYRRIRYHFYDAATRLFIESFSKPYYGWCEKNGLRLTGHYLAEDTLSSQTACIGAAMPHYEFMHWPGIDKLCRHVEQIVTCKQLSSAVDQLGKERAFCEAFGCSGQQVSFYHRKWIADWMAALGISYVNHHLSLYSNRGERKRDYPPNFFYQQPWWDEEKPYADYTGRLCRLAADGRRDGVKVLIVHPISSAWSEYSPLDGKDPYASDTSAYHPPFEKLSRALMARNIDFHYGDEMLMERHGAVDGGRLRVGRHAYDAVVVPPVCVLRENTLRLLRAFGDAAGEDRVVWFGRLPSFADGTWDGDWIASRKLVPDLADAVNAVEAAAPPEVRTVNALTGQNEEKVFCHLRTDGENRWLLAVNTDEAREIPLRLSVRSAADPRLLDLMTGRVLACPFTREGEWITVCLTFHPAGSLALYLGDARADGDAPAFLESGVTFREPGAMILASSDFEVAPLHPNCLPLQRVSLWMNGVPAGEDMPVTMALHRHFYPAPDGTPFTARYAFDVLEVPAGPVFAAVEMAENLSSVTLNGQPLPVAKPAGWLGAYDDALCWMDVNMSRVPLDGLRPGRNVLELTGVKANNITQPGCHSQVADFESHRPTEAETVVLVGDFAVAGDDRRRFALAAARRPSADLTASGYPFYAGKARFTARFTLDRAASSLCLSGVNAACVRLRIDGKDAGVRYWAPWRYDVHLSPGAHTVEAVMSATLFNLTGPQWIADILKDTGVGPGTFAAFRRYTEKYTLLPFGLEGFTVY